MAEEQKKSGTEADSRTPLDRLLGIVTKVGPGESGTALLLALNVCLLLSAYYVIKPVREAFILSTGGAEIKSYASVGQAALLVVLVPAYGVLVGKVPRRVLIPAVTVFFMGCLGLFYLAAVAKMPMLGVAFYLFVGIFNLMVVSQFWSFANDIYTQEQGERLFPVVAFGASIGAVVGSQLSSLLVRGVGINEMLLVSLGILAITIVVTKVIEGREGGNAPAPAPVTGQASPEEEQSPAKKDTPKDRKGGAFALVLQSPYLLLMAALMFIANLVNTTGEFILGTVVADAAKLAVSEGRSDGLDVGEMIGLFYGDFFYWVNVAGVGMQLLLVSRVIRWIGIRGALLFLPVIALGSYLLLAVVPVLAVVRWAKTAENSTDYSLNNTVRNALFLTLSREEKYKAKQAIDTFFVRGGDVASALVVGIGINSLGWSVGNFAWFNVVMVVFWIAIAVAVGKRYAAMSSARAETKALESE